MSRLLNQRTRRRRKPRTGSDSDSDSDSGSGSEFDSDFMSDSSAQASSPARPSSKQRTTSTTKSTTAKATAPRKRASASRGAVRDTDNTSKRSRLPNPNKATNGSYVVDLLTDDESGTIDVTGTDEDHIYIDDDDDDDDFEADDDDDDDDDLYLGKTRTPRSRLSLDDPNRIPVIFTIFTAGGGKKTEHVTASRHELFMGHAKNVCAKVSGEHGTVIMATWCSFVQQMLVKIRLHRLALRFIGARFIDK